MKLDKVKSTLIEYFPFVGVYAISRLVFWGRGIRFDIRSLTYFMQYLDIPILKNDLMRGLFYQHSQPPLYNFFLGIVLKLFPIHYETAFAVIYHFLSLLLYILMSKFLRKGSFKPWVSFLIPTLYILSPEAILAGNWLFYSWPIAVLLVLAAVSLQAYEEAKQPRDLVLFLAAVVSICLIRSMYHLIYLVVCIFILFLIRPKNRTFLYISASAALVLVAAVFVKNYVVFGFFGSSSWMGMNCWNITRSELPDGIVDPQVLAVTNYRDIEDYPDKYLVVPDKFSDIPALSEEIKASGRANFNYYGYLAISQEYMKGCKYVMKNEFKTYLGRVYSAWVYYSEPTTELPFFTINREKIENYTRLLTPEYWRRQIFPTDSQSPRVQLYVPATMILIASHLILLVVYAFKNRQLPPQFFTFVFMTLTIFYSATVSSLLDIGENFRFRMEINPLTILAVAVTIKHIWENTRQKKASP